MALWQFDIYLLPRSDALERKLRSGVQLSEFDFNDTAWWKGLPTPPFEPLFDRLLGQGAFWSENWRVFGTEDGDRVDVFTSSGRLDLIRVRIDVRNPSLEFIDGVCAFARRANCLLVTNSFHIFEPTLDALWVEVMVSPAASFVEDPQAFLRRLSERQSREDM
jgi:hypothetical protein